MVLPKCGWITSARELVRDLRTALLLGVSVMGLAACTTTGTSQDTNTPALSTGQEYRFTEVNADRFRPWSNAPALYRVGPGDKLKVKYFITRDMDEDLTVSPDGTIAPRAIGQIRVEGSTLAGVEDYIRKASRKELVDQKVVVALESASAPKVYVGGMVQQPGVVKLDNVGTSVLQAIMIAGGFSENARTGQVALIRRGPHNEPMLRLIDVREIIETGATDLDVPLMTGDVIFVPRTNIAELNLWIDQFINRVVPFQRQFSYTVGTYTQYGGGSTSVLP
ncbi:MULTISPECIES: polysaccharide biosynthesis/export family protein [unclassified Xanthobacter]|uniref:polysaccharide biosynthesis/export family protein n=1 Tax=unclassified Xanthobacter TaxID=2623496 RepID=UPI001EDF1857|nr:MULTISPECIES: polysaccharide biosynthesis/export family protein [unclassified Xanthobacter]